MEWEKMVKDQRDRGVRDDQTVLMREETRGVTIPWYRVPPHRVSETRSRPNSQREIGYSRNPHSWCRP